MNYIDKILEDIENEDTSAAAGLPGFDMPHTKKKPIKNYQYHYQYEQDEVDDRTKRIMIDVDRVLHSYEEGWKDGTLYGHLIPGSKEAINKLKNEYEIVIFTSRLSEVHGEEEINRQYELLSNWLAENEVYYDDITSDKRPAEYYIDDRALRFDGNWKDIISQIKNT